MKTQKRVTLPTAIKKYSNITANPTHATTANFMEFGLARASEMTKGQNYEIDMSSTVRLKPMHNPTYGNCFIHNRAYFVPFRTVMPGYNEMINDTTYFNSQGLAVIPTTHQIKNSAFSLMLRGTDFSTSAPYESNKPYDFVYYDNKTPVAYTFTPLGRYTYKILRSLGYAIYFDDHSGSLVHSALPLLCFMRAFYDYYFPSMYVDDNRSNLVRKWFNIEPSPVAGNHFVNKMSASDLTLVFKEIRRVAYDTDFFTAAWDNPVAPSDGAFSSVAINDPTMTGNVKDKTSVVVPGDSSLNGTPYIISSDYNSNNFISQFSIKALKSLSDYMHRNQIAGARTIDRFMARWGSAPIATKIERSQYIGEDISPIRIGDVTSTADTDGTPLGSYAGKGFGLSNKEGLVSYTADENGMLLIISTIVPEPVYYQGALRHTMHINRFDFYTPEFDNLGVQALSSREVYMPTGPLNASNVTNGINFNNAVFGFVPRYAEYKVEPSQITGDLVLGTKNVGMEGWTFGRDLAGYFNGEVYENVSHSQEFVDGTDADQYNRIFDIFDDSEDKFIVEHRFRIRNRFPGAELYDSYEYDSDGKASTVSIDINGVRAN